MHTVMYNILNAFTMQFISFVVYIGCVRKLCPGWQLNINIQTWVWETVSFVQSVHSACVKLVIWNIV